MFSFKNKNGKEVTIYDPSERGAMYANDLKNGTNINGQELSKNQKAYRAGYLKAQNDNSKAYKAREFKKNNPDYKNKTKHSVADIKKQRQKQKKGAKK
ncbi:MAG: hypothetical protein K2L47_02120 [Clostridia bacterium]|nr:hypothetical protein [Clostridia bacterium]